MTIQATLQQNKNYIIDKYDAGIGTNDLAKEFNCNSGSIYYFLQENNVNIRRRKNYGKTEQHYEVISRLFNEGNSAYKISKLINVPKPTILKIMKKIGLSTSNKSTQRQDKLINHKQEIIDMYIYGKTMNEISMFFNCSQSNISKILNKNGVNIRSIKIYTVNDNFFESIDNEAKAYILGWWFSDGNNTPPRIRLCITDKDILEKIKQKLQYNGPTYFKKRRKENYLDQHELSITSEKMSDDLIKLGCIPNKTLIAKFPVIPINLYNHFIRGYLDGDGSISKEGVKPRVQFVGTKEMIDGIISTLKQFANLDKWHISQRYPERNKNNYSLYEKGDFY